MRTIIVTVGTSLLSNAGRDLKAAKLSERELAIYLRNTDPQRAAAETNSLSRLAKEGDRLIFLHSQTDEGRKCADALGKHYEALGYSTLLRQVPDLSYAESRFKMRGLRSLVATLIDLIRSEQRQGFQPIINATGGFKAEIAYAALVGLLFDVPVYYIHEAFRDVIEMPPAPISWDYSLLSDHEEFFEWISADLRATTDAEAQLRGLPAELRLLLAEEEGFTFLSPAGEAFYEAYRERILQAAGPPILLSLQAMDAYRAAAPELRRLFDRALHKLKLKELRIHGADRVHNSDCLVFPKGHREPRLFFFEGEDGKVRVCELARHGDKSYDRLMDRGVRRDSYKDFEEWKVEGDPT